MCVCLDGFLGSNLSRPWPGALVQIRRGPRAEPQAGIRQTQTGVFFCAAEGETGRHSLNEQIMKWVSISDEARDVKRPRPVSPPTPLFVLGSDATGLSLTSVAFSYTLNCTLVVHPGNDSDKWEKTPWTRTEVQHHSQRHPHSSPFYSGWKSDQLFWLRSCREPPWERLAGRWVQKPSRHRRSTRLK